MVRVDLRTVTLNIPPQEVITRDNVPSRVNAVAYFRVIDPNKAIVEVENFLLATSQIAQTTLRSVLGKAELDQLLSERERLNDDLQKIIDEQTEPWGVKVSVGRDQGRRDPASRCSGRWPARPRPSASGGRRSSTPRASSRRPRSSPHAADIISTNPASLQLRYLQTLLEIGSNKNTTIVFPLPMDLIKPFLERRTPAAASSRPRPDSTPSPPERRRHELPRAPHRPADGDADHPRPRPGRAAGIVHQAAVRAAGAAEGCPLCEGSESMTPPEVFALRAGGGGRPPGLADPGRPEPLSGARAPPPMLPRPRRAPGPSHPSAARPTRCGPPRGPPSRTCSPRGRPTERTR